MTLGVFAILLTFASLDANQSVRNPCLAVEYKVMRPPLYPPEAVRDHSEGKTILMVTVGVDGVPSNVVVSTSSGNVHLDDAAADTVKGWRFEPMRCDGKIVVSQILVPVNFSLADEQVDPKSLSASKWEVAPDSKPMEFEAVNAALGYLTTEPGIVEVPGNSPKHRVFHQEHDVSAKIWFVDTASGTGWTTVIRWRQIRRDDTRWGLYSYLCDGPEAYCSEMRAGIIEFTKAHPPPPPPVLRPVQ